MILAEVSSGRSDFDSSSPTKAEMPGSAAAAAALDRRRAALAGRLEGRGAHRDDLLGVLRAHGLDRVAGIDRPLEGVRRDHLDDVGDLHDVEQRRDARHHVLAGGGRRRDDRVVGPGERDDQRGERLGQHVLVGRRIGEQHLLDAVELGGGIGHRLRLAGDQHVHVAAQRLGGGQRLVGGILERLVVVLGEEKRGHGVCMYRRGNGAEVALKTGSRANSYRVRADTHERSSRIAARGSETSANDVGIRSPPPRS